MTSRPVPGRPSRSLTRVGAWLLALLAAVGVLLFSTGTASAASLPDAGNRVRASAPETIAAVGVSEHVRAGQGRGPPVSQPRIVVATGVAAEGAPARFIVDGAGTVIDRSSIGTSINAARQSRHLAGTSNGGGYFNSIDDAQAVLDAFHDGSAAVLGTTRSGNIAVRVPSVTGFNNNIAKGYLDQPTNIFFIKGSSKVSVVPGSPSWTP
jgi:hypothetical protein